MVLDVCYHPLEIWYALAQKMLSLRDYNVVHSEAHYAGFELS